MVLETTLATRSLAGRVPSFVVPGLDRGTKRPAVAGHCHGRCGWKDRLRSAAAPLGPPGLRCAAPEDDESGDGVRLGTTMNKSIFDHETILKASRRAAEMADNGTREEQSGKFLPPPGWKGHLVTAADAAPQDSSRPRRRKAG